MLNTRETPPNNYTLRNSNQGNEQRKISNNRATFIFGKNNINDVKSDENNIKNSVKMNEKVEKNNENVVVDKK